VIILVLVQQRQEVVHHTRAAQRRQLAPGRLRGGGGGHGGVDVGLAGQQHLARGGAGGRVPHRLAARAGAAVGRAVDPVRDVGGLGEGFGCAHGLAPVG
jgi:hypothetical protein